MKNEKMDCHGGIGFLIFLFGLVFLLGATDVITSGTVAILWPIVVMMAGLKTMICTCMCSDKSCKK